MKRGMKNVFFLPISRYISKMVQDTAISQLQWKTNMNLYGIYPMVPFSMTLIAPN